MPGPPSNTRRLSSVFFNGIRNGFRRFSNGFSPPGTGNGHAGFHPGPERGTFGNIFRRVTFLNGNGDSNGFVRNRAYKNGILGAEPIYRSSHVTDTEEESDESPPYLPVAASAPPDYSDYMARPAFFSVDQAV